jgi:hypothetical protein
MIGSSVAQDFAPIGSKWYYDSVDSGQAPYHSEYFLYESVKDTLVASTTCKKITVSKFEYDGNVHLYPSLFVYGDTNEVFYYSSQFEKFCSLYKFNVSIGDTIEYCTLPSVFVIDSIFKVKVDTILYQTISNRNVKFIYTEPLSTSNGYSFSFWGSYSWYIGCLNMMLPQQTPNIPERDGPLRCYEDSDKTFSFNNDWPLACDFTITGIGDVNSSDNLISISPNPVISQLLFETKLTSEMNIELISSLGNIVRRFSFKNSASIDVGDLPSGLYFIQLLSDKNSLVYSEKIVKF